MKLWDSVPSCRLVRFDSCHGEAQFMNCLSSVELPLISSDQVYSFFITTTASLRPNCGKCVEEVDLSLLIFIPPFLKNQIQRFLNISSPKPASERSPFANSHVNTNHVL